MKRTATSRCSAPLTSAIGSGLIAVAPTGSM